MKLDHLKIEINDDKCVISCIVDDNKRIVLKVDKKYKEYAQYTYDGFVVLMLVVAMKNNENIEVNGIMSAKLYYNLKTHIMPLINVVHPTYEMIDIIVKELTNEVYEGNGVACGISCGMDSLCCVQDHYFNDENENTKLTHLTNFYAGAYSVKNTYHNKMKNIEKYVSKTDLELFVVDTNFMHINNFEHQYFHTLRNLSVPLFFQKLFKKYYYGSSFSYKDSKLIKNSGSITSIEPIIIPHLSTESLQISIHGCEYTRIKKTLLVHENPLNFQHLDVCVHPTYYDSTDKKLNCSKCFKCLRTLCTLDYYHIIQNFSELFDLDIFYLHKHDYLADLEKTNPYDRELIKLYYEYNPIIDDYLLNSGAKNNEYSNVDVLEILEFCDSHLNHNFHGRKLKENIWYAHKNEWTLIQPNKIKAKKNCILLNTLIKKGKQLQDKMKRNIEKDKIHILQEVQDKNDYYCTFIC